MPIELKHDLRAEAIASLKQYFDRNLPEPIGDLPAGLLFDFILQEIGPAIYNQAIADTVARLQQRAADLEGDMFEEPFTYWTKQGSKAVRRGR